MPKRIFKDPRYEIVNVFITRKKLASFRDVYLHVPKSVLAKDLGKGTPTVDKLLASPGGWTFGEILAMAKLFHVKPEAVFTLIIADYTG